MGRGEKTRDEIPSLDGLELDWDYQPDNPQGSRAYARITAKDLEHILSLDGIGLQVRYAKDKGQFR